MRCPQPLVLHSVVSQKDNYCYFVLWARGAPARVSEYQGQRERARFTQVTGTLWHVIVLFGQRNRSVTSGCTQSAIGFLITGLYRLQKGHKGTMTGGSRKWCRFPLWDASFFKRPLSLCQQQHPLDCFPTLSQRSRTDRCQIILEDFADQLHFYTILNL